MKFIYFLNNTSFSKTGINTAIVSIGLVVRMALQALIFFLAARVLGSGDFGLFSAVQSIVILGFPFANWGSGYILIKQVSRKCQPLDIMIGSSITTTLFMSLLLGVIIFLLINLLYSEFVAVRIALPLILGDVVGIALATISSQAFQSQGLFIKTSLVWVLLSVMRGIFMVLFLSPLVVNNIQNLALFYGVGGFIGGIVSILWIIFHFGWTKFTLLGMKGEWLQGFYFSISVASQSVYNNIDKALLSQLLSNTVAGIYSVAYKVIDFFVIPIQSLAFILFPNFFRRGEHGIQFLYKYALKILPWSFLLSLVGVIVALILSPVLPSVFGEEYHQSSLVVIYLTPILLFRSIHYIFSNILSGSDYQSLRSMFQIGIAVLNLCLNFWFIPKFGIWGAVYSSLISDGCLAIGLWLATIFLRDQKVFLGDK